MELISKEELINKINAYMVTTPDVTMVRKLINELPTIESRPKGKWELSEGVLSYEGRFDGYFCSECGKGFLDDLCCNNGADEIRANKEFNFCPFCGAEMESE